MMLQRLAATTLLPLTTTGQRSVTLQFPNPVADGAIGKPGCLSNRCDSAISQRYRFAGSPATAATFVEISNERVELDFQSLDKFCVRHVDSITKTTRRLEYQFGNLITNKSLVQRRP